ncbi:hypothetical protein CHLRE_04g217939v5 [Chlamydomonas reinhardtii]|uniref:Uncharacterized protein n=1 Tax=Chlamydomonas reinhardtii TaxID=3055 RepID=A0A2K3DTI1_CHLRE|nr:uncharacterized protein CHLRE_04g217939v5 [Chlamydomonas reinhardtii]PNW83836.1 hypothetical protein CHLRE_04g217939v5 [Chlamydomonas reinhardtii]
MERVSNSGGSRKAFAKAFTSLLGLQLAKPEDLDPDTLRSPPFPRYTPALSELSVQQLRPYFLNRTYTDTDVGYLAFFSAMHLVALVGGPLTYSPECLQLCLAGYVVTGMLGISMSYHRQLSHKSFRWVKPLEYLLAYCGALAFEGDPIEWPFKSVNGHPTRSMWASYMGCGSAPGRQPPPAPSITPGRAGSSTTTISTGAAASGPIKGPAGSRRR